MVPCVTEMLVCGVTQNIILYLISQEGKLTGIMGVIVIQDLSLSGTCDGELCLLHGQRAGPLAGRGGGGDGGLGRRRSRKESGGDGVGADSSRGVGGADGISGSARRFRRQMEDVSCRGGSLACLFEAVAVIRQKKTRR